MDILTVPKVSIVGLRHLALVLPEYKEHMLQLRDGLVSEAEITEIYGPVVKGGDTIRMQLEALNP